MSGNARSGEPRDLLNALLDGELSDDEQRAVREWLDADPDGRRELEALTSVRTKVRDLPAVDPPSGFFDRLLVDVGSEPVGVIRDLTDAPPGPTPLKDRATRHGSVPNGSEATRTEPPPPVTPLEAAPSRRRRSLVGAGIAAVAAVAAAFVLVLGVTPATDTIVPPVQAFADRHDSMTASPPTAPFAGSAYRSVPPAELDAMGAPYMAPASVGALARQSAYRHDDVVHLVYGNDAMTVSVYEQRGTIDWDRIPASGQRHTIGTTKAWETRMGSEEVMVLEMDGMVVTVIADTSADQMMAMVKNVPAPPETSLLDRASRNCSQLVRAFAGSS